MMRPGWMQFMRGAKLKPETEEYGVSSFVYRRRQAFHPQRLYDLLDKDIPLAGVIRSKGFCWLANHHQVQCVWSSAGKLFSIEPDGLWFVSVPETDWDPLLDKATILEDFEGPNGDRRQEIVIIGRNMDVKLVTKILDSALMKEGEQWDEELPDPWDFEEEDHEHAPFFEEESDGLPPIVHSINVVQKNESTTNSNTVVAMVLRDSADYTYE